ncbi:hypothetical protein CPB85DRAFT_1315343 [Mucidula mucida]|nr:hypothetical protein CPB85DRAFT_1315343 [Mucidula mucida]
MFGQRTALIPSGNTNITTPYPSRYATLQITRSYHCLILSDQTGPLFAYLKCLLASLLSLTPFSKPLKGRVKNPHPHALTLSEFSTMGIGDDITLNSFKFCLDHGNEERKQICAFALGIKQAKKGSTAWKCKSHSKVDCKNCFDWRKIIVNQEK